jgi:hypothetical protein
MTTPKRSGASRGEAFARKVRRRYELSPGESELLTEVARCLDSCERLEQSDPDGPKLRQGRLALARLLTTLNLPSDDLVKGTTAGARAGGLARQAATTSPDARSEAGRHAVMARWHRSA